VGWGGGGRPGECVVYVCVCLSVCVASIPLPPMGNIIARGGRGAGEL
jgi:hypothetical protein